MPGSAAISPVDPGPISAILTGLAKVVTSGLPEVVRFLSCTPVSESVRILAEGFRFLQEQVMAARSFSGRMLTAIGRRSMISVPAGWPLNAVLQRLGVLLNFSSCFPPLMSARLRSSLLSVSGSDEE